MRRKTPIVRQFLRMSQHKYSESQEAYPSCKGRPRRTFLSQTSVVDKTNLIQTENFKGMDANGTFRNLAHVLAPVGYLFL